MKMSEDTSSKVKAGWFGLKSICTGVLGTLLATGITLGVVDVGKIQDTISKAQARQVAVAAAAYSAEQAATSVLQIVKSDVTLAEKAKAITTSVNSAVANTKLAADTIISGAISDAKESGVTKENLEAVGEGVAAGTTAVKDNIVATVDTVKSDVKEKVTNTVDAVKAVIPAKTPTSTEPTVPSEKK